MIWTTEEWNAIFGEEKDDTTLEFDTDIRPVLQGDYNEIQNKPSINGVTLIGNKTNEELLIGAMSNGDIDNLIKNFV